MNPAILSITSWFDVRIFRMPRHRCRTVSERVMRLGNQRNEGGLFNPALVFAVISEQVPAFNTWYRFIGNIAPAFPGRQVETSTPDVMYSHDFRLEHDWRVRQGCYPSRVVIARK